MTPRGDWTGITRHGAGWRASVSRGHGRTPIRRHFPRETSLAVMQAWRADTKAALRLRRKQRATAGSFADDARRYLAAVAALDTYDTRARDIARWVAIFGTRPRDTITSAEIRAWRDRWLTEPRRLHPPPPGPRLRRRAGPDASAETPYSASTINHWLRALSNLWTVLDGRRAPNPVREVPEAVEPDALPRAIPYPEIEEILAAIPDRGRPAKGQPLSKVSLTKLRLRVLAYTGLTCAQLGRLTRTDVDLEAPSMFVRRRKKGKGAKPRRLGLTPPAVAAFRALDAAKGWGPFSAASVRKTFLLAQRKRKPAAGAPFTPRRVYDLRHSFGTIIFRATRSREAVRELLSHATLRTTERYTLAAVDDVLSAHLAEVAASQTRDPDCK